MINKHLDYIFNNKIKINNNKNNLIKVEKKKITVIGVSINTHNEK